MPLHTPSEKKKNKAAITKAAKESGKTGRQARRTITLTKLRKKK